MSAAGAYQDGNDFTPTKGRTNIINDKAVEAADAVGEQGNMRDDEFEDITDAAFRHIDTRVPLGYNWNSEHSESVALSLLEYSKSYYDQQI